MSQPHISELREHLMATLAGLRDHENPMEPDRARAVAQVAGVLVDTARVEVDYIKATGQDTSGFLQALPSTSTVTAGLPNGITSITQHRPIG
ncbi:hypothetical protein [Pantoea sp. 18069]|uniref:hypothetical protein n=1 Tax=Pantoea sp. 18069 TaxID=2681415 RepID=UPI00190F1282|nr:hypothetical protein [Pantoea sp. 18069]